MQLSEKNIIDVIFRQYERLQDANDCCSEPNCQYRRAQLWMCLACGYIGCGENENKHVYQHFTQTQHAHFVNIEQRYVWCYSCFQFVTTDRAQGFLNDLMRPPPNRKYDKWKRDQQADAISVGSAQQMAIAPVVVKQQNLGTQAELYLQQQATLASVNRAGELGIVNSSATCYMDSALQALAHVPYFAKWFLACLPYLYQREFGMPEVTHQANLSQYLNLSTSGGAQSALTIQNRKTPSRSSVIATHLDRCFLTAFGQAIAALQSPDNDPESPLVINSLLRALQAEKDIYTAGRQQDAQEFLLHAFEILQRALEGTSGTQPQSAQQHSLQAFQRSAVPQKSLLSSPQPGGGFRNDPFTFIPQQQTFAPGERNIVVDCFRGLMGESQRAKCPKCGREQADQKYEEFLSWPICLGGSGEEAEILKQLEQLRGVEMKAKKCEGCGVEVPVDCVHGFELCPAALCLQVKCYDTNAEKVQQKLRIPEVLDLQSCLDVGSAHGRFAEMVQTPVSGDRNPVVYVEKAVQQAVSLYAGRQVFRALARRCNLTEEEKGRPEYRVVIEALALCCLGPSFYEVLDTVSKEARQRVPRAPESSQKVAQLLRQIYADIQLIKAGRAAVISGSLRQKLSQKYAKDFKTAFDPAALLAGEAIYDLCAIVQHSGGSTTAGHYTAYVVDAEGQWRLCDAHKIVQVSKQASIQGAYLVLYQKRQSPYQKAIQAEVYAQIYNEALRQADTKLAEQQLDFLAHADAFCRKQLGIPALPPSVQRAEKHLISGDWLYRLLELPWAGPCCQAPFEEEYGLYAVQPAMVPPAVAVSWRLKVIIEAVFGDPQNNGFFDRQSQFEKDALREEEEIQLYDAIFYTPQKAEFALSTKFAQKWKESLFNGDIRFSGIVNQELCSEKSVFNRFELKKGLKRDADYTCISRENWTALTKLYRCFEVEIFQEDSIEGIGDNAFSESDLHDEQPQETDAAAEEPSIETEV